MQDGTAHEFGRTVGYVFGALLIFGLLIWGIVKCILIARRPTANMKCLLALLLVLAAALIACAAAMLPGGEVWVGVRFILLLPVLRLIIAGWVLAIVGLVEMRTARERFAQGRRQAVLAFVLGALPIGSVGLGVVRGILEAAAAKRVQPLAGQRAGELLRFDDRNFQFTSPPPPWVPVDAKRVAPDATLAFLRADPELMMAVTAEAPGVSAGVTSQIYAEILKAITKSKAQTRAADFGPCPILSCTNGSRVSRTSRRCCQWCGWGLWRRHGSKSRINT